MAKVRRAQPPGVDAQRSTCGPRSTCGQRNTCGQRHRTPAPPTTRGCRAFPSLVPTETGSLPPVEDPAGPPSHPRPFSPELLESRLKFLLPHAGVGCPHVEVPVHDITPCRTVISQALGSQKGTLRSI